MTRQALKMLAAAGILASCSYATVPPHLRVIGGDPQRGRIVVANTGCGVCHSIPHVAGARGRVGPPLEAFGRRSFIAGTMPNRPDLLIQFIRNAPSLAPDTAMPALPISEQEARDVASYLYTLR